MSTFDKIAENFTEEQKKQVDRAIEVITNMIEKVSDETRRELHRVLGIFNQNGIISFYSMLLNFEEISFDEADEIFASMGEEELRTEVIRRLAKKGAFRF